MPYDGFYVCTTPSNAPTRIDILDSNNTLICFTVGGGNWGDSVTLPFKKGDRLIRQETAPIYSKVAYYKLRDYSNR